MYDEIYIDVVFVTNLLVDYLLLGFVCRVFRCRRRRTRILAAAAFGALVSCIILYIPEDTFLPAVILLHGAGGCAMISMGCGLKKGSLLLKALLTLYFAAFLCGGVWEAVVSGQEMTPKIFFLLTGAMWLIFSAAAWLWDSLRIRTKSIYPVSLTYQGKTENFYALYDSGNLLTDPQGNRPVSIADEEVIRTMISEETAKRLKNLKEYPEELQSADIAGLQPHFLSCRTIGTDDGILLAVTLESLCIRTPVQELLIERPVLAVAYDTSALGKEYKVLLNSRLLQ